MDNIETDVELFATFGTPGFKLQKFHERKYDNDWEIRISGNYRVLFRWNGTDIDDVEYTDTTH